MLMVIVGGVVLLGVFLLFGQLWARRPKCSFLSGSSFRSPTFGSASIRPVYTVAQELPILLIVFAVPAAAAVVAFWQLARP